MKTKASSGIFGLINGRAAGNYTDGPPNFQAGYPFHNEAQELKNQAVPF